jgi:hypothetical protein
VGVGKEVGDNSTLPHILQNNIGHTRNFKQWGEFVVPTQGTNACINIETKDWSNNYIRGDMRKT